MTSRQADLLNKEYVVPTGIILLEYKQALADEKVCYLTNRCQLLSIDFEWSVL